MDNARHSTGSLEAADEAEVKFDYFMTGLSAAIVGYIAPKMSPHPLGLNPYTLELCSMLLFVVAIFAGLKRIEASIRLRREVGLRQQAVEIASDIQDARREGSLVLSVSDDSPTRPEQLRRHQEEFVRRAKEHIKKAQRIEKARVCWYSTRYFAIVAGFLSLLAANVWQGCR